MVYFSYKRMSNDCWWHGMPSSERTLLGYTEANNWARRWVILPLGYSMDFCLKHSLRDYNKMDLGTQGRRYWLSSLRDHLHHRVIHNCSHSRIYFSMR